MGFRQKKALSLGLVVETGGQIRPLCLLLWCGPPIYFPGGCPASDYGGKKPEEDWAESVTAVVYPGVSVPLERDKTGKYHPDEARKKYVRDMFNAYKS
jgi:hypothetical protein